VLKWSIFLNEYFWTFSKRALRRFAPNPMLPVEVKRIFKIPKQIAASASRTIYSPVRAMYAISWFAMPTSMIFAINKGMLNSHATTRNTVSGTIRTYFLYSPKYLDNFMIKFHSFARGTIPYQVSTERRFAASLIFKSSGVIRTAEQRIRCWTAPDYFEYAPGMRAAG